MRSNLPYGRCSRCSREHFVLGAAAAAGALLAGCGSGGSAVVPRADPATSGSLSTLASSHTVRAPVPIPANSLLGGLHLQIPPAGLGDEISTVYNFNGSIGRALAKGDGTGNGSALFWSCDMGFMDGEYRATDGRLAHGTFAFV